MGRRRRYVPRKPIYKYDRIFAVLMLSVLIIFVVAFLLNEAYSTPKVEDIRNLSIAGLYCKVPEFTLTPLKDLKVHRTKLKNCNNIAFLTSIVSSNDYRDPLTIKIHSEAFKNYKVTQVSCCYHIITQIVNYDVVVTPKCVEFVDGQEIDRKTQFIFVKCSSGGKDIYTNAHAVVSRTAEHAERIKKLKTSGKKVYKVLLLGINSLSRMNLKRGMPKSYGLLDDGHDWFELKGYTRIKEDSFSNIFAILTGHASDQKFGKCDPTKNDYLDDCSFIWNKYRKAGYITSFAEDQLNLTAFNQKHKGFRHQPTDFYFHPFVVAAEKLLEIRRKDNLAFCLGHSLYLDEIFVYALKLISIHESDPFFGFFFVNSLSNKQLVSSPIMDTRIAESFIRPIDLLKMDDTFVVYFGHGGTRFEEDEAGFYEERNPFLFLRIPKQFQRDHPTLIKNLRANENRLTTPYDVHITLQHILALSSDTKIRRKAVGCRQCQSLFDDIGDARSCSDVHVSDESCPCSLQELDPIPEMVNKAAIFALKQLNAKVATMHYFNGEKCKTLELKKIVKAFQQLTSPWNLNYIIIFEVSPSDARFEAQVTQEPYKRFYSFADHFVLLKEIAHINAEKTEFCVPKSERNHIGRRMDDDGDYDYDDQWAWENH